MVYITATGSIQQSRTPSHNPIRWLGDAFASLTPEKRAVALAAVAIAVRLSCRPSNPLADGTVPAAARAPHEHWAAISTDLFFVRSMTEHLGTVDRTNKVESKARFEAERAAKLERVLERVDFGGPDGHVAEDVNWSDLESIRATRCSTAQSAVTAYFCGAAVAGNQDVALGDRRKGYNYGIVEFAEFVSCRHQQGERNGGRHRRSVYRLNIGCKEKLAGYSHAWSIVAQPDGTFFWLQSFIIHYSLNHWMTKVDSSTGSPHGHLSLADLQAKLRQVDRLTQIKGWTAEANADYLELFGVDKEKEAAMKGKPLNWRPAHRLYVFAWDEACEYPLPIQAQRPDGNDRKDEGANEPNIGGIFGEGFLSDECTVSYARNQLKELFGEGWEEDLLDMEFD